MRWEKGKKGGRRGGKGRGRRGGKGRGRRDGGGRQGEREEE